MEIQKEVVIVDFATGEVCAPRPREIRRTEPFFMTYQKSAIDVAKKKFSGAELSVLLFLQGKADYDNIAQVSQAFIAKEIGNTEATVSLAIKHLVNEGVISVAQVNGRKAFVISYV